MAEVETDAWPTAEISRAAQHGLDLTDAMSPSLRECVHEYGFAIVDAFLTAGIKEPRVIRHLVNEAWNGARQPAQRTGGETPSGRVLGKLDWLLCQSGSAITAATLVRVLWQNGMVIVPREPTEGMIEASIEATGRMGLVSKAQKHRGRLRAAMLDATAQFWPHLLRPQATTAARRAADG